MSDLPAESLRPLAVASGYQELLDALRARKAELGLSDAMIDMLSGLAAGHTGKLLGPAQVKILGPVSMGLMLQTLGLVLIVAEDAEQTAKMKRKYARRSEGNVRENNHAHDISIGLLNRAKPVLNKKIGEQLTEARKKIKPATRRRIARHAAMARWKWQRLKRKQRRPKV